MGKQGLTPRPTEKQHTPSSSTRSRKDSKSPGGLKGNKKTHGQQGAVKGRRGRSGNNTAASKDTVTMAEAKPDDEVKLEQPKIDLGERSEDERDADTFEDAQDTNGEFTPPTEAPGHESSTDMSQETSEEATKEAEETQDEHLTHSTANRESVASSKTSRSTDEAATEHAPVDDEVTTADATVPAIHESQIDEQHEAEVAEQERLAHKPSISTSTMDDVSLGDIADADAASEQTPTQANTSKSLPSLPPSVPLRNSTASVRDPVKGLSGELPAVNYPPPPPPPETKPSPLPPPPPTRKVSSPFAWFSRATSRKAASPTRNSTLSDTRRNTASSLATLGSNIDTEELRDRSPVRPRGSSLKDRFHMLRLQEETVNPSAVGDSPKGQERERSGSMQGITSGDRGLLIPAPLMRSNSFSAIPSPAGIKLPPGTAAGVSAGPSDDTSSVNWDLWQAVVYEGPAAVNRTSGEELNHAIASGIPQPIRGVVWQVLADSKNPDLEVMYKDLVARGTDKENNRPTPLPRTTSIAVNGTIEKESLASSASSIKSDASTPTTALSPAHSHELNNGDSYVPTDKKIRSVDDKAAIQKLEKTIRRDLGARTSFSKYLASAGLQEGLFGLCKAYALFDEAVGYAQGMNFIAMPLLFNMPEEEAFTLFVRLMSKYNLRSMFTAEMTGLHLHLYQFERLLEDFEPALYCHLHRRGVSPNLYATQWFLTLFAYRFPLQLVLRVFDLILSEGLGAILKFGIALMQKNAHTLLEMKDMSQLSTYLKERLFDVYIDKSPSASSILESGFFGAASGIDKEVYRADELVRDACAVNLPPLTLATYAAEFEEQQRTEKEREAELEHLRSSNASLTTRVRNLEERAQQHDTEHVGIASELVRTKVENEALEDENEGLKTQVVELRKMVESAPAEVEERLRSEMERIMQRNIEVQNENRALEESVQETEQELVGTKMMFAELNAEHDSLKQKLATIQSMFTDKK